VEKTSQRVKKKKGEKKSLGKGICQGNEWREIGIPARLGQEEYERGIVLRQGKGVWLVEHGDDMAKTAVKGLLRVSLARSLRKQKARGGGGAGVKDRRFRVKKNENRAHDRRNSSNNFRLVVILRKRYLDVIGGCEEMRGIPTGGKVDADRWWFAGKNGAFYKMKEKGKEGEIRGKIGSGDASSVSLNTVKYCVCEMAKSGQ